ncbi:sterol carrier family protein [Streptomyces sp. SHP 1-2]|uniref:sterol carrier family protein n=1 Tax=Streptomyces sp. SHP 1-2 TaxID=2769489 RepID=UPI002237752E|nr:sterol carrier family protein [Streptomyces sp. SHP 1-2]MCW5250162.1 maleylpyruvate isomerase N-terminal domain-containing protein [Streptomyces sp. SHP 1-2]
MPPARKRARAYDPVRTRAAVLAQSAHLRAAVRTLTPERLALPAGPGDRTVEELIAHAGASLAVLGPLLEGPGPVRQDARLLDWPSAPGADADAVDRTARALAAAHPVPEDLLMEAERRFTALLDAHPGGRLLPTGGGALPLADFVVTRAVELVVHSDDLDTAVPGLAVRYDRGAMAAATRLLADALAARAPGGSTEVRIPPHAVVQCVEGPRHTRGTPPNVVETDPLTWVRLATGRLAWRDAVDDGRVRASGERADLAPLLPLAG